MLNPYLNAFGKPTETQPGTPLLRGRGAGLGDDVDHDKTETMSVTSAATEVVNADDMQRQRHARPAPRDLRSLKLDHLGSPSVPTELGFLPDSPMAYRESGEQERLVLEGDDVVDDMSLSPGASRGGGVADSVKTLNLDHEKLLRQQRQAEQTSNQRRHQKEQLQALQDKLIAVANRAATASSFHTEYSDDVRESVSAVFVL